MNKKGLVEIFLFLIFALTIVIICAIFLYMGTTIEDKLHETLDNMSNASAGEPNYTAIIDDTFSAVPSAYVNLRWGSYFLIIGMVLSIFIGNYLITSRPIFFIPYIFVTILGIVLAVVLSKAYETIKNTPTLSATFDTLVGANFILEYLPIWVAVIGIIGGVIMVIRIKALTY